MGQDLKHLAFVFDGTLDGSATTDVQNWVRSLVRHCTTLALHSLDEIPGLEGLSFYYPELQDVAHGESASPDLPSVFSDAMHDTGTAVAARGFELALLGFPDLLPGSWASVLTAAPFMKDYPHRVNFLLGYSAREEIVRAADSAIGPAGTAGVAAGDLGAGLLSAGQPDPDFIIYATKGFTPRNFMIWQASYAEIWHASTSGLDFTASDLDEALELYSLRVRRFGKV